MVNLSSVVLLSIGYTLIVLALNLMVIWRVLSGKEEDLFRRGLYIMGIGVGLWVVVGTAVWLTQGMSSQEWGVFAGTGAINIFLTGGLLAIQGWAQKKPESLPWVKYGGMAVSLIGLTFVFAWFVVAH